MLKNMAMLLVGGLLAVGGFIAGRSTTPRELVLSSLKTPSFVHVQNTQQTPVRPNNDARELIPLNPGGQQPGGQGQQPPPGQGQQPQDCPVQIYQDGKLFTFPQPGQQPQPGQNSNQPGQSGLPQEIIPLQPSAPSTQTPSTPGTPKPNSPAQPRSVPIQPSKPSTQDPENPLNPFAPTLPGTRS